MRFFTQYKNYVSFRYH